jgi:hypothetical protein
MYTPHTEASHVVEPYRLLDYESANESENRCAHIGGAKSIRLDD